MDEQTMVCYSESSSSTQSDWKDVPKTLVHIADYGSPVPGSFIAALLALCRAVVSGGDHFVFVCTKVPGATWHDDFLSAGGTFFAVGSTAEAVKVVRRQRPDVIHTHFSAYDLPILVAFAGSKTRIYWHFHFTAERAHGIGRIRQLVKYRILGQLVTSIVTVSYAARFALINCGAAALRVTAIQNGIDTGHFRPATPLERESARRSFGLAQHERVIVFFGRNTHIKGGDVFWGALDGGAKFTLLLIAAPAEARAEFARRVRVVYVDRLEDTRIAYWAANELAVPSRTESWGYVLAEALSCGLPAIASNLPALVEVAGPDAPSVRYFEAGNSASLRNLLLTEGLASDGDADRYRQRFQLETWVRRIIAMYQRDG